jgi:hypothetical protein
MEKVKRNPNSAASGNMEFGHISRRRIHHNLSPLARATSTKSFAAMSMAIALDTRATLDAWITPTVATKTVREFPKPTITTKESRIGGNEIKMSIPRLMALSIHPPVSAAVNPKAIPVRNPRKVAAMESPIVMRAPWSILEKTSLPR